ncbi:hypothetical protein TBLA_0D05350 [Henningerozyma blattae CBS 6284]|uniref:K Homology domain-containing protein n=1 Tax=Henningerozyma blattae (strain ATCC 34711 / CBS 6284 / DSM 70876 / NBRC 10599 / NRRL Y-10934 / UCD 77-7) TaxID=1071380 RepID=I2H3S6_HENB6|nr:hypothetical protein TBLA_0D05350 [Tetrapisispora blattae CBS 6284]CCH61028.1 hypothetical protein TBLA_0D05350 [Tetrapisispora blattae CBS 6284]
MTNFNYIYVYWTNRITAELYLVMPDTIPPQLRTPSNKFENVKDIGLDFVLSDLSDDDNENSKSIEIQRDYNSETSSSSINESLKNGKSFTNEEIMPKIRLENSPDLNFKSIAALPHLSNRCYLDNNEEGTNWKVQNMEVPKNLPCLISTNAINDDKGIKDFNFKIDKVSKPMISKVIQLSFKVKKEDHVSNLTKTKLDNVLVSLMKQFNVKIESTVFKESGDRLFILSGLKEKILESKRLLLKNLTKPVSISFTIPFKTRSAIIGLNGNTIESISKKYSIKINLESKPLENSFDEYLNDNKCNCNLIGDSESIQLAKLDILKIVNEQIKDARFRVCLLEASTTNNNDYSKILPFINCNKIANNLDRLNKSNARCFFDDRLKTFNIFGNRKDAIEINRKLQQTLKTRSVLIIEKKIKIPIKFQVLINIEEINKLFGIMVNLSNSWNDESVTFVGEIIKVERAIQFARESSKGLIVDTLDVSKSHGGNNLKFTNWLLFYFKKYKDIFERLSHDYNDLVTIYLPNSKLINCASNSNIYIVAKEDNKDQIKHVRKEIINLINQISPEDVLEITNIDYSLFGFNVKSILNKNSKKIDFVQLGDFIDDNNTIILFAKVFNSSNDNKNDFDFKPSDQEIKTSLLENSRLLDPLIPKIKDIKQQIFELNSNIQDEIFGKGSVSLNLLNEEVSADNGNLSVKFHSPDKNSITLIGTSIGLKLALRALTYIKEEPSRYNKKQITIPSHVIPRLVGNKGSHLSELHKKFDVSLDIPQVKNINQSKPIEITITGLGYNIRRVIHYLNKEVDTWADIITFEKQVPVELHQKLLGPQNEFRERLQKKYNVKISFLKENELVTIRGSTTDVKKAQKELNNLLDFEIQNNEKIKVQIPFKLVSKIIGKGGEIINGIRIDYNVEINSLETTKGKKVEKKGYVDFEIIGSKNNIQEAKKKLDSIINESENISKELDVDRKYHNQLIGINGSILKDIITKSGGDPSKGRSIIIPPKGSNNNKIIIAGTKEFVESATIEIQTLISELENQTTENITIPKEKHSLIIGTSGIVRQEIEEEFSVILNIPSKNSKSTHVSISGLPENIEKAKLKINDILAEFTTTNTKEVIVPAQYQEFVSQHGFFLQTLRFNHNINVKYGSDSRRAMKFSKPSFNIPDKKIRTEGLSSKKNITFTVEKFRDGSNINWKKQKPISWILEYDPLDFNVLEFEDKELEQLFPEMNGNNNENIKNNANDALEVAQNILQNRIELAKRANYAGYIWCSNPKRFTKVIGSGGSRINEIRRKTETLIIIPRKTKNEKDIIFIRGTEEQVREAGNMILESLKN